MKVLITGATGLVGKEIVKVLHEKNITVHYLTRSKRKIHSDSNYKGFYWDPSTRELDPKSLEGVHTIINLAGATIANRWTKSYKRKIVESRVESLRTLKKALDSSDISGIQSIISASAIGIYPNSLSKFYDESEKEVDDSFLGTVVEQWEDAANEFKDLGLKVAKIRIGVVLSTKGGALPKMARPVQMYLGAAFGSGEQWQSWIHIEDLAEMFVYIMENGLKGTFNGVAPNPVTQSKMTKILGMVLNKPIWLPNIPKFAMQGLLGEMSYLLFASQRVSSKRIEKKGFVFQYPNLEPALMNLYDKEQKESYLVQ
ncbi:TIGR01777 family oxidoreductase [Flagellimonas sp.]|uniref:TIGR01777 family oxidoreductase n=1 Tax=Flagellimonas sp. TaxID=2058762 RepID=UPI003B5215F9